MSWGDLREKGGREVLHAAPASATLPPSAATETPDRLEESRAAGKSKTTARDPPRTSSPRQPQEPPQAIKDLGTKRSTDEPAPDMKKAPLRRAFEE
jgi:hypothetical protein